MDRQDIDALLIGALYGELTPADEARLSAHLESHPADRGALDDLKSARTKLRESRFFDVQLEPPQHISALLLQEAHRKAPRRAVATESEQKESWFWRFAKSFLAHPAMAAAAMLVVVVGVAGTLYMKKGEHFADREVSSPTATAPQSDNTIANGPAPQNAVGAGSAATVDQQAYQAGLADESDLKLAETAKPEPAPAKESASNKWESQPHGGVAKNKGIAVTTEQPQPKDLERAKAPERRMTTGTKGAATGGYKDTDGADDLDVAGDRYDSNAESGTVTGAGGGGAKSGGGGATRGAIGGGAPGTAATTTPAAPPPSAAQHSYAQPPPPPAVAQPSATMANDKAPAPAASPKPAPAPSKVAKADTSAPDTKPVAPTTSTTSKKVAAQKPAEKAPAAGPTAQAQDSTLIGWAKDQHQKSIALAKSGDCTGAAKVAMTVNSRAPEYYSQYMATDRSLKSCRQYIEAEREKEAAKVRAQKKASAADSAK